MRYLALACDYDGTLAHHGRVDGVVLETLEQVRTSGRRLLLVTGRVLDDLRTVFDRLDLFDCVVAENGAHLHWPSSGEDRDLGEPPPPGFVDALRRRYVPTASGRVIVATWEPHEQEVLETIRDLGLELHVIFNKGAVMVLPAGVSKASGLQAALDSLGLSPHNVVAVGDAENDHAFLAASELAVAVANALPTIRERADVVTAADHGAGVVELALELLRDDLAGCEPRLERHHVLLGGRRLPGGGTSEVRVSPYGTSILVAGSPGAGKSTFAAGLLERLVDAGYQCCVIDPEGEHDGLDDALVIGSSRHPPSDEEIARLLHDPRRSAVVNLLGERLADRPAAFAQVHQRVLELRRRAGRPHWLVVDEAHHVAPAVARGGAPGAARAALAGAGEPLPFSAESLGSFLVLTVEPRSVAADVLGAANLVVTVGDRALEAMREYAAVAGTPMPQLPTSPPPDGEALVWDRRTGEPPYALRIVPGRVPHERHLRKYASGELAPDRSFYFRGPEGKLNLRSQNLVMFNQIAEGVDEATWLHHLRHGDYSRWFRAVIKDEDLAQEVERIEQAPALSAAESRDRIRDAIERRYTVPV